MKRLALVVVALLATSIANAEQLVVPAEIDAPTDLKAWAPSNDDGTHIKLEWASTAKSFWVFRTVGKPGTGPDPTQILGARERREERIGKDAGETADRWELLATVAGAEGAGAYTDTLNEKQSVSYAVVAVDLDEDGNPLALSQSIVSGMVTPKTAFFNTDRWFFLALIAAMALALLYYIRRIKKTGGEDLFIRRIAGVDAIEEAVGRSTEMGRPVLYVTGVEEIQNIQTIASLLVLGHVAEMVADYDTEMKVANFFPLTMVVAEEIVKQGFNNAGRADAHKPENVMFISAEQFAFAAGVNGLILRDKPATNIYLGRFFAESLILAETGFVTKAIQIAGTAEITQLPFFIAACDYTIIGEELYAVSAYLSRDPVLLAQLKATDLVKLVIMILAVVGAGVALIDGFELAGWLMP